MTDPILSELTLSADETLDCLLPGIGAVWTHPDSAEWIVRGVAYLRVHVGDNHREHTLARLVSRDGLSRDVESVDRVVVRGAVQLDLRPVSHAVGQSGGWVETTSGFNRRPVVRLHDDGVSSIRHRYWTSASAWSGGVWERWEDGRS